jgi:glycosyltransferase involved in cell wall biosynthesis
MRIVQAIETAGPGGTEEVLIGLCKALREMGHDVSVVLIKTGWLQDRLEAERIPVDAMTLHRPFEPAFVRRLAAVIANRRADVLHTHEFTLAFYGKLAGRSTRVPLVATAHGANFARGFKRRILGAAVLRPSKALRLTAVSGALARIIASELLVPVGRIQVVRNGIDIPPPVQPRMQQTGAFRLVAVGNLYPVKNHGVLVRVVGALRRSGVPAELDVLGRGSEEASLRAEIGKLGLTDAVRLQGFRSDVAEFLQRADVFVSSSVSEQMPLSFLEAMARGLPVVASRVGGVPEIVDEGSTGLLFDSGDETTATAHLQSLWLDPAKRIALGKRAREIAEAQYGVSVMAETYAMIYRELAIS